MDKSISLLLKDIDNLAAELHEFLVQNGIYVKSTKLSDLVEAVKKLKVIHPRKKYFAAEIDKKGYVKAYNKVDALVEAQPVPKDLLRGYYQIEKGKITLDEEKRKQIWGA
jgi:hypothetical protein